MKILIVGNLNNGNALADHILTQFGSGTIINTTDNADKAKAELEDGTYDVAVIENEYKSVVSDDDCTTHIAWLSTDDFNKVVTDIRSSIV